MIGKTEHIQKQKIFKFFCRKSSQGLFTSTVISTKQLSQLAKWTKSEWRVIKAGDSAQINSAGFNQKHFRTIPHHISQFTFN